MKKIFSLIVAVAFALSLAGAAFAADAGTTSATAPKTKKVMKHKKAVKKTARLKYVYGEVTAVDSTAGTLTLKSRKGEVSLDTTAKTMIHQGRKKITLADIKAGDKVSARYSEVKGKNVAKSVYMRPVAAKKAKKAKKAAKKKEAAPASK